MLARRFKRLFFIKTIITKTFIGESHSLPAPAKPYECKKTCTRLYIDLLLPAKKILCEFWGKCI